MNKQEYGNLNGFGPHRLICYIFGVQLLELFGGVTSLEEMCHWVWSLRFQKSQAISSVCVCFSLLLTVSALSWSCLHALLCCHGPLKPLGPKLPFMFP